MADFEAPSFSLGLDCDLLDSEPPLCTVSHDRDPSSTNQFSVPSAALEDEHDHFETLVVDDSEPEYPDPHPKLKRLRRGPTVDATPSSVSAKAELHSTVVVYDEEDIEVFSTKKHRRRDERVRRFQSIDSDSDDPSLNEEYIQSIEDNNKAQSNAVSTNWSSHVSTSSVDLINSLPPANCYFFHEDPRIQKLVRTRLPNFSPLGDMINREFVLPSTSNTIDYMGQFCFVQSSKQAARNNKESISRKVSRKSKAEETSPGWINPKLGVDKGIPNGAAKRKVHAKGQAAGHWFTCSDGKKVYFCKNGQELTGRVAYMQHKKESGSWFKKAKRKSGTKKKK